MTGYVVDVEAEGVLSRIMTSGNNISEVFDEMYRLYAKEGIKLVTIKPEKGKK
jgi:hypothetical protein